MICLRQLPVMRRSYNEATLLMGQNVVSLQVGAERTGSILSSREGNIAVGSNKIERITLQAHSSHLFTPGENV
jgi:hypothetical protein